MRFLLTALFCVLFSWLPPAPIGGQTFGQCIDFQRRGILPWRQDHIQIQLPQQQQQQHVEHPLHLLIHMHHLRQMMENQQPPVVQPAPQVIMLPAQPVQYAAPVQYRQPVYYQPQYQPQQLGVEKPAEPPFVGGNYRRPIRINSPPFAQFGLINIAPGGSLSPWGRRGGGDGSGGAGDISPHFGDVYFQATNDPTNSKWRVQIDPESQQLAELEVRKMARDQRLRHNYGVLGEGNSMAGVGNGSAGRSPPTCEPKGNPANWILTCDAQYTDAKGITWRARGWRRV